MTRGWTRIRWGIDWCLRALGVFALIAFVLAAIGISMQWNLRPPETVKDVVSFRVWRPDLDSATKIEVRDSTYYAVQGEYASPLPSSKSEYYFDSNGNLLGWNMDPGDYKNPSLFFDSDASYTTNVPIETIAKPGHIKSQ